MHFNPKLILGIALIAGLIGCAAKRPDLAKPEHGPAGISSSHPLTGAEDALQEPLEIKEPAGSITLREAIHLALVKNPELAAFSFEIRAREAGALQAGLLPNPEITAEFQEIGGSGIYSGTRKAESTILLSQLIELGGKRSKRKRVASLSHDLAWWDYETKRLDVLTDVTKAFIGVLASQERLSLTKELAHLAQQVYDTVSERVKAGKVSHVEQIKAGVALSTTRIKWERAKSHLESARKRLAAIWGSFSPVFKKTEGEFYNIPSIQLFEQLADRVLKNPDIARWNVEMEKGWAAVELEDARRIPDLTLSGGIRRFNETSDNAFVAGVSIPLPLFNRNQGGLLEARYKFAGAAKERSASELRVRTALAVAYQTLSTAHAEAIALKNELLPGAWNAFDAAKEGFRHGKFGFLDVLDAQRTLFEAKGQYIETLTTFHKAFADMERLTGTGVEEIKNAKGEIQ